MNRRKLGVIIFILLILYGLSAMAVAEEGAEELHIEYEEPNGKNQYYTKKPTVTVYHGGKDVITKIQLKQEEEILLEKTIDNGEKEFRIEGEEFKEGRHILCVWQENEKGEVIEETKIEREFHIDTVSPEKTVFQYEGSSEGKILYFQKETVVKLQAKDNGAGVENIFYQIGKGETKKESADEIQIELPKEFKGEITAWVEDKAGNRGDTAVSKYIVCDAKLPQIEIHTDLEEGKWYSQNVNAEIIVEENGVSSGVASIRCYFNGKQVKEIEKLPEFCQSERVKLQIKEFGELLVEVRDYAGNISWKKQKMLIDKEKPEITVSGSYPNMITSRTVHLEISAKDRKQLKEASFIVKRKNDAGESVFSEKKETKFVKNSWITDLEIEEDGIYTIELKAVDMAGNVERKEEKIIVDKTNPIIRYVEDLDGKWIKSFEWRYPLSEFIFDLTKFRYEIRLDGKMQTLFLTERKEGKHIFYVKATDVAGNEAVARAEFVIDHTKPEIFVEGAADNESYEEKTEIKLGVKDSTERLEEVWINGEKQKTDADSKLFRFTADEIRDYNIVARAVDLAGNQSVKNINFSIMEKKNILEKVFAPIETEKPKNQKEKKEHKKQEVYLIAGIVILAMMGIMFGYKMKKRPHKREDAE